MTFPRNQLFTIKLDVTLNELSTIEAALQTQIKILTLQAAGNSHDARRRLNDVKRVLVQTARIWNGEMALSRWSVVTLLGALLFVGIAVFILQQPDLILADGSFLPLDWLETGIAMTPVLIGMGAILLNTIPLPTRRMAKPRILSISIQAGLVLSIAFLA